jgi:hypothetical protein
MVIAQYVTRQALSNVIIPNGEYHGGLLSAAVQANLVGKYLNAIEFAWSPSVDPTEPFNLVNVLGLITAGGQTYRFHDLLRNPIKVFWEPILITNPLALDLYFFLSEPAGASDVVMTSNMTMFFSDHGNNLIPEI